MSQYQAWYRDSSEDKPYEAHTTNPAHYLNFDEVFEKTGVRLTKVVDSDRDEVQDRLRKDGGYFHYDWLEISRTALADYEEKLKDFNTEHLHKDDEVRLVTAGSAFFEVRDCNDKWIRLHLMKGDMILLPKGIYHRLSLDPLNYIKMLRLFSEVPQWVSVSRPAGDSDPARKKYLESMGLSQEAQKSPSQEDPQSPNQEDQESPSQEAQQSETPTKIAVEAN